MKNKKWSILFLLLILSMIIFCLGVLLYDNNQNEVSQSAGSAAKSDTTSKSQKEASESAAQKEALPEGQLTDWNLVLVNKTHSVENTAPSLLTLANGFQVLDQIQTPVETLINAAQADGIELKFVSAYRSVEEQQAVVSSVINQNISAGMSEADAKSAAMSVLTEPGYSEHHTGLAIDLVDTTYYQNTPNDLLNEAYADTDSAKWLAENAPKYGFILRYPKGKEAETGINFEPWHYRYVGVEHAMYITQNNLTLEAYIKKLQEAGR